MESNTTKKRQGRASEAEAEAKGTKHEKEEKGCAFEMTERRNEGRKERRKEKRTLTSRHRIIVQPIAFAGAEPPKQARHDLREVRVHVCVHAHTQIHGDVYKYVC